MTRPDFRDRLLASLGGPWPPGGPLNLTVHRSEQADGFRRHAVSYDAEPGDRVPAYLLVPDGATAARPAPGVCVWHQHNGAWHLGAHEPAGVAGMPEHHTGVLLARAGFVVLCPHALGFGDRQDPDKKLKGGDYERWLFLRYVVAGKCLAWKNILDMRRAVDVLAARPEVRADRLGCYGHSMGSTCTWLVGPWEPRLRCLVGNCCLPTYAAIHRTKILHCFTNFVPGLLQFGDTPDVAGLIAPRPLLLNFGETDAGSPVEEVRAGVEAIRQQYRAVHAEGQFEAVIEPGVGHVFSRTMQERTVGWLRRHLA